MKIACNNCQGTGTQFVSGRIVSKDEGGIRLPAYSIEKEIKCCICNGSGLVEAGYRNILLKRNKK